MNSVKYTALLLFALAPAALAAPVVKPEIQYFHYERNIQNTPQSARQTCVAVDPAIFAHASPGLADLRIYRGKDETPYVLRKAKPAAVGEQKLAPMNLGRRDGHTVFDAAMPAGAYSDVQLDVTGKNFIATVEVSGSQSQPGAARTRIGSYTIFDLTRQKLGRSTVLHLPRSDFRFLHFRIDGPIAPQSVNGLRVLRVAASHPRHLTVAASSSVTQQGRDSVLHFTVPARTPVDRIVFAPGASPADFSRDVQVRVQPEKPPKASASAEPPSQSTAYGNLLRIHRIEEGHRLNEERLSVAAPYVVSAAPTDWTVTIENGDDRPISLRWVRLEMVERDLCFYAEGGSGYRLYYGDSALAPPRYDYATLFTLQPDAATASLGPEVANPDYQPRPDTRPFTERHPALLWAALVLVILLLAAIALRSARHTNPQA